MNLEEVHRREWARVVAALARALGDLDVAEDAAAEAFATAVARWPVDGVPDEPAAWLVTVGRNKGLDRLRREATREARQSAAHERLEARRERDDDTPTFGPLSDDRLRLVFTCCHPALAPDDRIALTLRLVAGLRTAEVARAFWVPEATMARRLVRAKQKIAAARIPYRVPEPAELPDRLAGVLRVVSLIFREGYAPSGGEDLVRLDLAEEAIRLARLLRELMPDEGEVAGLLALLLFQHSRAATRLDDAGDPVLLADQDRARWDRSAIGEAVDLTSEALVRGRGPWALQAAVAACHATAPSASATDWETLVHLFDELARLDPSPAVALNRAVAVAEAEGPAAGLAALDGLLASPAGAGLARTSHHPHLARAELLRRLDRTDEARTAYDRALDLVPTAPERRHLTARRASLDPDR